MTNFFDIGAGIFTYCVIYLVIDATTDALAEAYRLHHYRREYGESLVIESKSTRENTYSAGPDNIQCVRCERIFPKPVRIAVQTPSTYCNKCFRDN